MTSEKPVVIVGAGLAGLCCARELAESKIPYLLLESSDNVGGRVRTDVVDGFLLDRGFQILLTAYPECKRLLDYDKLQLRPFVNGAKVRIGGKFQQIADPMRNPEKFIDTLFSSVGTTADKLRVGMLRQVMLQPHQNRDLSTTQRTTLQELQDLGFSTSMIEVFFRPFFGGIFLDPSLETASSLFEFVFEMLAKGDNVLPARGMQSIPLQLAQALDPDRIRCGVPVASVNKESVTTVGGEKIFARAVVIATEEPQCQKLLGMTPHSNYRSQISLYFAADEPPYEDAMIALNGESSGPVRNLVIPSNIAPTYAPPGKALINAVIFGDAEYGDAELERAVREQMSSWFGTPVQSWRHLKTYRIRYALPDQSPTALASVNRSYFADDGIFCCGDYKETGSINGAMVSGRKAAQSIVQYFS